MQKIKKKKAPDDGEGARRCLDPSHTLTIKGILGELKPKGEVFEVIEEVEEASTFRLRISLEMEATKLLMKRPEGQPARRSRAETRRPARYIY